MDLTSVKTYVFELRRVGSFDVGQRFVFVNDAIRDQAVQLPIIANQRYVTAGLG